MLSAAVQIAVAPYGYLCAPIPRPGCLTFQLLFSQTDDGMRFCDETKRVTHVKNKPIDPDAKYAIVVTLIHLQVNERAVPITLLRVMMRHQAIRGCQVNAMMLTILSCVLP